MASTTRYVQIRAVPAEGHTYRWGGGRAFTKDDVTLEVVETPVQQDPIPMDRWDLDEQVRVRLSNIEKRKAAYAALAPHQIHVDQLADIKKDPQIIVIENAPPPPAPPKSETEILRERVAKLEKSKG